MARPAGGISQAARPGSGCVVSGRGFISWRPSEPPPSVTVGGEPPAGSGAMAPVCRSDRADPEQGGPRQDPQGASRGDRSWGPLTAQLAPEMGRCGCSPGPFQAQLPGTVGEEVMGS